MNHQIDAIYARQSGDRKDSISIENQIDFCKHELKGGQCKEYVDRGFSGKNTERPEFQALVRDIEQGKISRVVVYKLDCISRSIIDFANMMELFQRHNVEFVSATEKFDTSTPMGRAMLNICIVFAQLERETIQKRITDAYYARCQRGFRAGGRASYGYKLEPTVIAGVNCKKLVADPETAAHVKLMFEMYAQSGISFGDIARYFVEHGILFNGKPLQRTAVSYLLRNPVYVQADLDVYEFYKSQGADVVNDVADFNGINGCYFYKGRDVTEGKYTNFKNHVLVMAPHEGIIPSDIWLACRKKLMQNSAFGSTKKAKHTWLAGKIKCGQCGAALNVVAHKRPTIHFRCRKHTDSKACTGCGTLSVRQVEQVIYGAMQEKLGIFQTLSSGTTKANPKLTALNVELVQVEHEIKQLLGTLTGANATLLSYANSMIEELDAKRQALLSNIADATTQAMSTAQMEQITNHLNNWDSLSFEDKRIVAGGLLTRVNATSESIQIEWKL
ncbi:MAG: recombinase family protein [Oscillospiraceae bacterium]|nr:recombinase family protein [Oscillospiraceae bacterium]